MNSLVAFCRCALENMMLAAHVLGIATRRVRREKEVFASPKGKAFPKERGDGQLGRSRIGGS